MPSSALAQTPNGHPIRVLLIDDDRPLCTLIQDYLQAFGYEVHFEYNGIAGAKRATAERFHAIILDLMLPGIDGLEVLKQIRNESDIPILMLTARGKETDRIVGLEMGADDYLPKTFSSRELLARLRAVTRRIRVPHDTSIDAPIVIGPLRIQPASHVVHLNGQLLKLTSLEFDLLLCLAKGRGQVKTREHLIETIGDRLYDGIDRSIDVHIWSLRRKLGDDPKKPRFIRTVRAVGYLLIDPETE